MDCKICKATFNNIRGLTVHLNSSHKDLATPRIVNYIVEYEKFVIPICKNCGNKVERRSGLTFRKTCSPKCVMELNKKRVHSDSTKKLQSQKRKEFLKNNPDKHSWKGANSKKSKPCENVKDYLRKNNIQFIEEWTPLDDRFFSIDIAFPDEKIGLEINGNQHYDNEGNLMPYYQERHDLIVDAGWKLLEIHYSLCFDDKKIGNIIEVGEQPNYSEYFRIQEERKMFYKQKYATLPYGVQNRLNADKKWEPYKKKVLESGIDFTKFGWCKSVGKVLGLSHQKVNWWMKRYLPELYEEECFKRNVNVSVE